ncbi:dynamin family protein [Ornithinimicrobium cryptoxanthini]|uniref:Dynamin family protein n=1 Tax=Ornithinimicrobium cryptoxanthini TaxID=2934161 RepID=A0ABY4YFI4_9MICO|nr:dynamin family protein [Ornithinimicrobium cryptoxanthini]USQ75488.1 dynamin family protein [Ornithinimicrobium cryptoxanthini]
MTDTDSGGALLRAVEQLRGTAERVKLTLDLPGVEEARTAQGELVHQLDDYVLPRLRSLDAPLLCVVGGSTGAGKSTLVNSLVGETVSRAGVLRPTTRASVLVHHPDDKQWFEGDRILPGLSRVTGSVADDDDPGSVRLTPSTMLPAGLGLLDAPDIDSVVTSNRDLARQLLAAADLWLFVTTAARYADAVPWTLLREAAERGTSVAIVLDRVPPEAMEDIRIHLAQMLREQGLSKSPIFTIAESALGEDGMLPSRDTERLRGWLHTLAGDAKARSVVIRRTLEGALGSLAARSEQLAQAGQAQTEARDALRRAARTAYSEATQGVEDGMEDGSLLRGEVLARWQELVGTGEFLRQVEAGISRLRDRLTAFFTGKAVSTEHLGEALQSGAAALVTSHAQVAAGAATRRWKGTDGGPDLIQKHPELAKASPDFDSRVERTIRDWQGEVLTMVRDEAGQKRTTARYLAFGVNALAVMLMLIVFTSTAGLTGAEVGIAGGSAVLAQRLLEAIFGDQAVRELAARARKALLAKVAELYDEELGRYETVLDDVELAPQAVKDLSGAAQQVEENR